MLIDYADHFFVQQYAVRLLIASMIGKDVSAIIAFFSHSASKAIKLLTHKHSTFNITTVLYYRYGIDLLRGAIKSYRLGVAAF